MKYKQELLQYSRKELFIPISISQTFLSVAVTVPIYSVG
jgi:hypothetical protein